METLYYPEIMIKYLGVREEVVTGIELETHVWKTKLFSAYMLLYLDHSI